MPGNLSDERHDRHDWHNWHNRHDWHDWHDQHDHDDDESQLPARPVTGTTNHCYRHWHSHDDEWRRMATNDDELW